MSVLLDQIKQKAIKLGKTIVLPEGDEQRIVDAAEIIAKEKIASIILIGDEKGKAAKLSQYKNIKIVNPAKTDLSKYAAALYEIRKSKGLTEEAAKELVTKPLYLGVMMVKLGEADGMVAGSINSTGDVLRPALQIIKTAPGITTVSSCFIMVLKDTKYGENGVMVFGDCAVMPNPTAQELASIAVASAETAKVIAGIDPKVAMLSFSTKGSAKDPLVDKVVEAYKLVKELAPTLNVDGELQADAALVESVGQLKSPGSKVAGKANVLIFPDLQSGNIGYKLVQRLAGAEAIGPICQGFNMPVNDLSRGCSSDDVVSVVAMTALQSVK